MMSLTKKQINRALTTITEQLNSTFLDEVKQEQEKIFLSSLTNG